jgi:type IV pilus assembly protein PilW
MTMPTAICRDAHQVPWRRGTDPAVNRGFSMVELMVAMVLGLLLVAVVGSIFAGSSRSYKEDSRLARMQENGRFAMSALTTDLDVAGFWATVTNITQITLDPSIPASTCGVSLGPSTPITVLKNSTNPSATFTCLPANGPYSPYIPAGGATAPDVVVVQRVLGTSIPSSSVVSGTPYLSVAPAGPTGVLIVPGTVVAGNTYWQYLPRIYYICNYPIVPGSATLVPSLCRWDLLVNTNPTLVAEGVENMQVEFGIDLDKDGAVNKYEASPSTADLQTAVNLRLFILSRSRDPDPLYTNTKTYNLGSVSVTYPLVTGTPDNYYRRVYTSTLPLRNIINRALLSS